MNDHVDLWLDAYLDGELQPSLRQQIESHLAGCAACRQALARRQALSALLQQDPQPAALKSPDRFVAEVGLQLERRPLTARSPRRTLDLAWLFIPSGLLLSWIFLQIVFLLSAVLDFIPAAGQALQSSLPVPPASFLLSSLFTGALAGQVFDYFQWNWFDSLASLFFIGGLYCCWMIFWWVRARQHENKEIAS